MRRFAGVSSWVVGFLIALFFCAIPQQASAQSWYAHWWCNGQRQCEATMGGSSGTAGPFGSPDECEKWRRTYNLLSTCNQSASGGERHSNPGPIPFPQSIIVYPGAVAGLSTIFGQGGAEFGGGVTATLVLASGMRDHSISTPVVLALAPAAGAVTMVGVAKIEQARKYPNPACKELTAEPDCPAVAPDAPKAPIARYAIMGAVAEFVGFVVGKVAVGSKFRTLPPAIRPLARLRIGASGRGVSARVAW